MWEIYGNIETEIEVRKPTRRSDQKLSVKYEGYEQASLAEK